MLSQLRFLPSWTAAVLRFASGSGIGKEKKEGKIICSYLKRKESEMGSTDQACSCPSLKCRKALSLNSVRERDE